MRAVFLLSCCLGFGVGLALISSDDAKSTERELAAAYAQSSRAYQVVMQKPGSLARHRTKALQQRREREERAPARNLVGLLVLNLAGS